jgi:ABC-type transport system involved in multi-copper enzyme maturation permease subunit
MKSRLGVGPVFAYEWLTSARRWQPYAVRALFVGLLLAGMAATWWVMVAGQEVATLNAQAAVGRKYGYALIGIALSLVLLAAPAATAGAICTDKARGNLTILLVTDLSDAEIVLGKLAARLVPVLTLICCSLPVLGLGTLMGGLDPGGMALAMLVTADVAILACSLALAISVWAVKVHEALMATYTALGIALLILPIWDGVSRSGAGAGPPPAWLANANPYWLAYAPSVAPDKVSWVDFAAFTAGCTALAIVLVGLAWARLRAVATRTPVAWRRIELPHALRRSRRLLPGPSLDANPVLWREWHRNRPSTWGRIIWAIYATLALGLGSWGAIDAIVRGVGNGPSLAVMAIALEVLFGLLLVAASAPTSLAEERHRGSLDAVMTTPLPTWSIVWGKWWGTFRVVPILALGPGLLGFVVAFTPHHPRPGGMPLGPSLGIGARGAAALVIFLVVLAHGAFLTSLGLALATWVKRQGRAAALEVVAYVLMTIGWPILMLVLFERAIDHSVLEGLVALSPVFAAADLAENLSFRNTAIVRMSLIFETFWLFLLSGWAIVLLLATWVTFDRRLGRVSEDPSEWVRFAGMLRTTWHRAWAKIAHAPAGRGVEVGS